MCAHLRIPIFFSLWLRRCSSDELMKDTNAGPATTDSTQGPIGFIQPCGRKKQRALETSLVIPRAHQLPQENSLEKKIWFWGKCHGFSPIGLISNYWWRKLFVILHLRICQIAFHFRHEIWIRPFFPCFKVKWTGWRERKMKLPKKIYQREQNKDNLAQCR